MIGNAVKASSPSMLGARKPDATRPSVRRPVRLATATTPMFTGTAMVHPLPRHGSRPAGQPPGRLPRAGSRIALGLGLAEQVLDRALAVVGEHGLLGEGGDNLLPGRHRGVRDGVLQGVVH